MHSHLILCSDYAFYARPNGWPLPLCRSWKIHIAPRSLPRPFLKKENIKMKLENKRRGKIFLPESGNWPFSILRARNKLTSGNMWVKQVVRITPPPKHERAEMSSCPLGVALWPILQHLLSSTGNIPRSKEMPPSATIEMILACIVSILKKRFRSVKTKTKDKRLKRLPYLIIWMLGMD